MSDHMIVGELDEPAIGRKKKSRKRKPWVYLEHYDDLHKQMVMWRTLSVISVALAITFFILWL